MAIEKKFVREQMNRLLIAEFLQGETDRAGFGGIDIQRTPMGTRVSLIAERPGMVIGRRGSNISRLTSDLSETFKAENPQIEVIEAGRDANLNAKIMARKVAEALERGWHFRRAGHSTVRRIMESGAKGCIVVLSGKLTGQRHRTEKFIQGHIKYNGDTALQLMDVGYAQCKKKLGTIGCTVKIMHPNARLPDEIDVFGPGEKELRAQAAAPSAAQRAKPEDDTPAEERPEGVPVPSGAATMPQEEGSEERRSRRRVPSPQPTEEDRREAEELARRMAEERESRKQQAKKKADKPVKEETAASTAAGSPGTPDVAEPAQPAKPAEPAKPVEKPVEKPAEKKPEPSKPAEPAKPAGKPAEKPAEKPAVPEKPAEKPVEKPAEPAKPAVPEKPAEKLVEKPAEPVKPEAEKPSKKEEKKPAEAQQKKPAKKSAKATEAKKEEPEQAEPAAETKKETSGEDES